MRKLCFALALLSVCLFSAAGEREERTWITVGSDAMNAIKAEFNHKEWRVFAQRHRTNPAVTLMEVTDAEMNAISRLMHHKYNRCSGFIAHGSYEQAIASGHRDLWLETASKRALSYTLDRGTEVNTVLPNLSEQNIIDTITSLANFGSRYYTTQTSVDSANWLKSEWEAMASGRSDISVQLVSHSWLMPSVVLTITGAHQPQDIVVMGGHLDSTSSTSSAPGADDDASGIATLTEALRAALAEGYTPARTIKIMGYAAEEVGLRGSADLADAAVANGDNVIGVLQLDMTNYQGSAQDIWLMQDYTNAAQNSFVGNLVDTYTGASWSTSSCGYGCSDHASWHNRGFAASMPFESRMGDHNPYIHTPNDTLSVSGNNAVHALKFARLAASYMIEMGKGGLNGNPGTDPGPVGGGGGPTTTELTNGVPVSGLSGSTGGQDLYHIDVPAGASNLNIAISGGSGDCDLYTKFGSVPTTGSWDCRPYQGGNNESCSVASPSEGTYYIMLYGYSSYSGMTLTASFDAPGGNNPPSASFSHTANNLSVNFTDGSSDSDGSVVSWSWNFGDGGSSSSQNPSHSYASAGTYTVSLTVTDNDGASDSTSQSVTVSGGGGGSWTELANTDFESGMGPYTIGGSDCRRSANDSAFAHQGTYCVRLRDNSGSASSFYTTNSLNLSGYSELQVTFWYYPRSMENGEDLFIEVYDGSSWQVIGNVAAGSDFTNDAFYSGSFTTDSGSVSFNNSNKIRIRCDASGNSDYVYVDELVVSAR